MQKSSPIISILIVYYHIKKELFDCLNSIYESKLKIPFEIIIVDHDEQPSIEKELKSKFPEVNYIVHANTGWGDGVNAGTDIAKGKYLYFLNPDTILLKRVIDPLYSFLEKYKDAAVTSSLLLYSNKKPHELQGSSELTPLKAIIVYSLINKLLPKNKITKKFWSFDANSKKPTEVEIAPLTAALIKRDIFIKAGGFDKRFFLYFEEYDLGKRLQKMGLKSYIVPSSKVIHLWGQSTKNKTGINKIFAQSRFRYFKKYFGLIPAVLVESFLRINKYTIFLSLIMALGLFLRFYQINILMPFIGDQGWFYLSARDILLTGNIPLVGIASSHPWLHQGALWTYLLAFTFELLGFNPINGAHLSIALDVAAIFAIYKLGAEMFSRRLGFIATVLYATSPLVILNARMPYHTSPIPLFTILYIYFLYKWMNGNKYYFPLTIASLTFLYNLEIATFILSIATGAIFLFSLLRKKTWTLGTALNIKILLLGGLAFAVPMLPMLIYDFNNGFPQTLGFIAWIGYKLLNTIGVLNIHNNIPVNSWTDLFSFFNIRLSRLFIAQSTIASLIIYLTSLVYAFIKLKRDALDSNIGIILTINFVILLGLLVVKTPSDAYLPMFFVPAIILVSYFIEKLLAVKKFIFSKYVILLIFIISNIFFLFENNFLVNRINGYGPSLQNRQSAAQNIVKLANNNQYNLVGKGAGSQFESFTMNYEYLTWHLGNPPQKEKQKIIISISESYNSVIVY